MSSEGDIEAQLEVVRRNFAEQLPRRLADLEASLSQWLTSGVETDLAAFHRLAHNLSGAGGTYGFPGLSQVAQALEQEISNLIDAQTHPAAVDAGRLRSLVAAVAQAIAEIRLKSPSKRK